MRLAYREIETEEELASRPYTEGSLYRVKETQRTYCDMQGGGSHTCK